MLKFVIEEYEPLPGRLEELNQALGVYKDRLIALGYLAREHHCLWQAGANTIRMGGIACHDTAMADSKSLLDSGRAWEAVELLLQRLPRFEQGDYLGTADHDYCNHDTWKSLVLICDPILGVSPVRCDRCGGIVARYRLPLRSHTQDSLWYWDRQYAAIYTCWLMSADYEAWAQEEVHSPTSRLNVLGREVADAMAAELVCDVQYHLPRTDDA